MAISNNLQLPHDFIRLLSRFNGMESHYPNDMDNEGFLFYPIEEIIKADFTSNEERNIFVFAGYMHKSWLYGYEPQPDGSYIIGIIPAKDKFQKITDSLSEFLELYLIDSPTLYQYTF